MKLLFVVFVLISKAYSQDDESTSLPTTVTSLPIFLLTNEDPEFTWAPQSTDSVIIEAEEGYKIAINVTVCNIDGENGEYASITTDGLSNGLTFTYKVGAHPSYLYNSNILYGNFYGTDASNFTVVFTRVGYRATTTTTEIPTTTIPLPTPHKNESTALLVYLKGKTPEEYDEAQVQRLKDSIVNMATEYCDNENFPLNGTITSSNVIINTLGRCPMNWPDSEICVELNFSVPVNLLAHSDSIWKEYQMTTQHLRLMWQRYASNELPDDITYFFEPDLSNFKWEIVIATAVIVVFILGMFLIRYFYARVSKSMRRRKLSDTTSIITTSDRNSQTSLPPHYLQETPPLFENAYPMYNPDKLGTTFPEPTYTKPMEYQGYQDLGVDISKQHGDEEEESGA